MAFEGSLLRDLEGNVALLNQAEEDNAGTVELVDVDAPQDGTTGNYKYTQPAYGGAITVTFAKTAYSVAAGTVTGG